MNKEVKQIFSDIYNQISRYQASVSATLSGYEMDLKAAQSESAKYKDEKDEFDIRKSNLVSAARSKIREADKTLHDAVTLDSVPKLREALSNYVCKRADRGFVEVLRDFKDFGLMLSRSEIDALIRQADGSYTGLRMLSAVAEKSGFKLSAPSVDDYEKEITEIEKAVRTPIMWVNNDHLGAAIDVLEDVPLRRADGTVYGSAGRPTAAGLLLSQMGLNQVYKNLAETGERWATSFVPEISAFKPVENEDGEITITQEDQHTEAVNTANAQVKVNDQSAVDMARKIGAAKTAASGGASKALDHFAVK